MSDSTRWPGAGAARHGAARAAVVTPARAHQPAWPDASGECLVAAHDDACALLRGVGDWSILDVVHADGSWQCIARVHADDEAARNALQEARTLDAVGVARALLEQAGPAPGRLPVMLDGEARLGAFAIVPVLSGRDLVGVLTVGAQGPERLAEAQIAALGELSERLVALLVTVRRATRQVQWPTREALCAELDRVLGDAVTPTAVAEAAVRVGREALGARAGALWLLDPLWRTLELTAASGVPTEMTRGWSSLRVQGPVVNPITEAVAMGRPLWIASRDELTQRYPELVARVPELRARQALGVLPLIVDGRTLGMLAFSYPHRTGIDPRARALLTEVAERAARALDRARVAYEQRMDARARLDGAFGVSGDVLGSLGTLVMVLDADGGLVRWNPACERLTGYRFDEVRGAGYRRMLGAQGQAGLDDALRQVRAARGPVGCELSFTARSGERRWIAWSFSPLARDAGEPTHFVATGIDVSDTRRARAERARALREEAERLAREDLLAMASHDLKEPLAALRLQHDMMMRALRRSPERVSGEWLEAAVERSRRTVDRAVRLIDELLTTGRTTGPLEVYLEELDLASLARDVLARHAERLEAAGCSVTVAVEGAVRGRWDRVRLEQVLTNLLTNAAKYGAGRPVVLALGAEGSLAWVEVIDGGPGVAPEYRDLVFERFYRATEQAADESHGLGLWIAKRNVERMGGTITVGDAPGGGAVFRVELPR